MVEDSAFHVDEARHELIVFRVGEPWSPSLLLSLVARICTSLQLDPPVILPGRSGSTPVL
jgi:hypothetical protein